jgi:DNA-binding SARP family transcriptional activator/TolB-like protein/Tfp pilus assembly protein PilF
MILFRTLGNSELEEDLGASARPIAVQAKRLALLAYAALAGRGRHRRRDSIVALFWPDLDEEHARSALRQALTYLRRTLGASAVVTRGEEEIGVDPEAVRCDAVLFDEAVAAGKLEDAMALYRGDFLDGLFVSDASPELGQWIDTERSRLRQAAATCGSSLAERSWQRGDGVSAARWARAAAALGPDDERKLRWLITLLDSIGDRAGALEAHERFAHRLASEYSAEPSAETKALMSAVRSRSAAPNGAPSLTPLPRAPERTPHSTHAGGSLLPEPILREPARRKAAWIGVGIVIALAFAAVLGSAAYRRAERVPRATVAVLPIRDLGADSTDPYLADALTEQLITSLARSRELTVINRRTMMTFRRSPKRPSDIARELDADVALTSAVRRVGDSVRLRVQLVRASDAHETWAWSSPAASGDLLRLAERVADSVAEHTLGTSRTAERTSLDSTRGVDPIALHSYIEGRYWWNKRGPGLLRSIGIFTAALDRDPTFALAYSGMADAYVQLGYGSLLRPDDAFPKARAAAEHALELDPTLAEPHATLGFVKMYYDWDWAGAEREFRRALTLNPSYATAHEWYGLFLAAMGRFDEAREHEHRAQVLDPLSIAVAGTAAWVLYYAGKNDDAERELRIALRADSTFALGRFYLGRVHQSRGRLDSALAAYHSTGPLREWVPTIAAVGHVYGSQGRRQEALATLTQLDSLSRQEYVTAYAVALVHASLGQRDSAFAWLDRGVAERTHWMVWLRRDPRWAPIRSDPRFEILASRLKLPK